MPKYETVVQISGTRNGQDWPPIKGLIDLPADEAKQYLAAGLIVEPGTGDVETSTAPEPETATTKSRGRGSVKAAAAKQPTTASSDD